MKKASHVVLFGFLLWMLLPVPAWSAFVVDSAAVAPSSVPVGVPTTVTLTAVITDPSVIPESVYAQRLDSTGRVLGILGILHDDGVGGDVVAGDRTFTIRLTVFEQAPGAVRFRVSAAFRGRILRAISSPLTVSVTSIAILEPANLAFLNTNPVRVTGTVADPGALVTVNGIPANVLGGLFQAFVALVEGTNTLTAVAQHSGGTTSTATVQVTLDTTPPQLSIQAPTENTTTFNSSIAVAGTVDDLQAQVTVNGLPALVASGSFLAANVPLAVGLNTIQVIATDPLGNFASASVHITRLSGSPLSINPVSGFRQGGLISSVLPQPLVVVAYDGAGTPVADTAIRFVILSNGLLTGDGSTGTEIEVLTNASGEAQVSVQLGPFAGANEVLFGAPGFNGNLPFFVTFLGVVPGNADYDQDGISDFEEVTAGADGFITNPMLPDSDEDGVRDGLEITTGSDPTNPVSLNLAQALESLHVTPANFTISIVASPFEQLAVTGRLRDGTTINLTSTQRGTTYASNNLTSCNVGTDGGVSAFGPGSCTITISNSGFVAEATGTVTLFSPVSLSSMALPGYAHNAQTSPSAKKDARASPAFKQSPGMMCFFTCAPVAGHWPRLSCRARAAPEAS